MSPGAEAFWSLRISDCISFAILLATIFAIYFGPIRAVEVSRRNDLRREAARRQRDIFAALMRTRAVVINPDQVWSLNLIQLEFYGYEQVQTAYKSYIANLSETIPAPGPPLDAFNQKRRDLFFDLLHELATAIGLKFDKRDLERAAYVPSGWVTQEDEIRLFRRLMIELLNGQRAVPVAPFQASGAANPYPPPPGTTLQK
jgi:hypothetical protein